MPTPTAADPAPPGFGPFNDPIANYIALGLLILFVTALLILGLWALVGTCVSRWRRRIYGRNAMVRDIEVANEQVGRILEQ